MNFYFPAIYNLNFEPKFIQKFKSKPDICVNVSKDFKVHNVHFLPGEIVDTGERYQEGHEGNDEPAVSL